MIQCDLCGRNSSGKFCEHCGSPLSVAPPPPGQIPAETIMAPRPAASAPPAPSRAPGAQTPPRPVGSPPGGPRPGVRGLVLVGVALVAIVVGLSALLYRPGSSSASYPEDTYTEEPQPATTTSGGGYPTSTDGGYPTSDTSQTSLPQTEDDARAWLETESNSFSVTTDGHYLVELSAKFVGATDPDLTAANGSHTFYFTDIVAEYVQLKTRFGDSVHMVKSTTFGKQRVNAKLPPGESIYVTIYDPQDFGSEASAKSWCAASFPGLSAAKLLNVCHARDASYPH